MFIRSWENHYVSRSGVFIFSQETSALAGNNYFEKKVWVLRNYALLWRLLDSLFTAQKERGNLHSVVEIAKVAFVMRLRDPAGSFMSLCIALSLAHDCTPMASTACKTHGSSSLARLFWTGCPVQFFWSYIYDPISSFQRPSVSSFHEETDLVELVRNLQALPRSYCCAGS